VKKNTTMKKYGLWVQGVLLKKRKAIIFLESTKLSLEKKTWKFKMTGDKKWELMGKIF